MRILIILSAPLNGASGNDIQQTFTAMMKLANVEVAVLAPFTKDEQTIRASLPFPVWELKFDSNWLNRQTKKQIAAFFPDIIHLWGNRHWTNRAAIECVAATGATLLSHMEDDDTTVFNEHGGSHARVDAFTMLDHAFPKDAQVKTFLSTLNWEYLFEIWRCPERLYGPEPLSRAISMHLSTAFTAIWHPMAEYLQKRFLKPVELLPPVINFKDQTIVNINEQEYRNRLLSNWGFPNDCLLVVYSGTKNIRTGDLELFLNASGKAVKQCPSFRLVLCGHDRAPERTSQLVNALGLSNVTRDIGVLPRDEYARLLSAADILACPETTHPFNHFRLPARMAEFMSQGKPIFTSKTGFGESLRNNIDAMLTYTDDLDEWTDKLTGILLDANLRRRLSQSVKSIARQLFDCDCIARRLYLFYTNILSGKSAGLKALTADDYQVKTLTSALDRILSVMATNSIRHIALYGAGQHTQKLLHYFPIDSVKILAILDDSPKITDIDGIPVVKASSFVSTEVDAILISSDAFETTLYKRAQELFKLPVYRLYE